MRLARRLERRLRNGASILVERSWQVEFARQGRGVAVSGVQLSANVQAPARLAELAELEQSRSTAQMWPILLSGEGRIIAAGEYIRDEDLTAAIRQAEAIIAARNQGLAVEARLDEFLGQMQRAGTSLLEQLPPDLFYPAEGEHEIARPVILPEGLKGEFVMTYVAHKAMGRQWLGRAERRIATRIGDDERRSSEIWELSEL